MTDAAPDRVPAGERQDSDPLILITATYFAAGGVGTTILALLQDDDRSEDRRRPPAARVLQRDQPDPRVSGSAAR